MIDINISLFIQLANFIVLMITLNFILFRPVQRIMQEREENIAGAFSDAKAARDRAQSLLEQYNAIMAEAKQKAAAAYNAIYQQGLDSQREMIAAERTRATELLEKARKDIAAASQAARADLRREAEKLSEEITSKLLGRTA
jgi:F-type H+-transporting ATPase subunit b